MRKLAFTTPCTRPTNLHEIHRSIFMAPGARHFDIEWNIVFDADVLREVPITVVEEFAEDPRVFMAFNRCGPEVACRQHEHINELLRDKRGEDFWHYVVDDDNLAHPRLLERLHEEMEKNPLAQGFIFSQQVGGRDSSDVDVRHAAPENVGVSRIDQAQFVLHAGLIGERSYPTDPLGDERFIAELYRTQPQAFAFIDEVLCHHNALRGQPEMALPRVLVFSRSPAEPDGLRRDGCKSDRIDVRVVEPDANVRQSVAAFDPDAIVSFGATPETHPQLFALPFDLQRRWLNVRTDSSREGVENHAYERAMEVILERGDNEAHAEPLVSIFTPVQDTGTLLWRAYRSVASQGYTNWEWVLVDDSRWGATTLATARDIASRDPRVRPYDLHPKSGGIAGEAKYRAAVLCRGAYLLELDCADELTPWAVELLVEAFRQFPEAGFAYSDWAMVDDAMTPLTCGPGSALDYGSSYEEVHRGITLKVARQPAPNPKTVRDGTAIANHFRAWRREIYHAVGGHNRRLSVAGAYELVLRTFLATRMVHVPKLCYLQYPSGGRKMQQAALGDTERSVRSISRFYDARVHARFEQLGLHDWAAQESPADPLAAPSRFGSEEQSAALTMKLPRGGPS